MGESNWDVVVVGGGPAGATAATLLRKYNPSLRVLIVERERFPRPHIGESQLPAITPVLEEMGVWDAVERANFPIKLGASFTWGRDEESWDFDFYPVELFRDEPRPAKLEGQRRFTAFQVERAIYDEILLRHAEGMGAVVREGARVAEVLREGDGVLGLRLEGGEVLAARHYLDASGSAGLLRRAMGIETAAPRELRNIAIWDYWENAEWAVHIGVGGTRIQVRSLPYGWIWFIPLGPTRTSVGLVCPSSYYRERGLSPEELYRAALQEQGQVAHLLRHATARGQIETTKDWSYLADRIAGENWLCAGEACGFADPILSAGMTLAHQSARDAAYTILELERGEHDAAWLRRRYNDRNRLNIRQHIRFAQFWYASNGCFGDLKENCRRIAAEAGLSMTPKEAWEWLARGGFTAYAVGTAQAGSFNVAGARQLVEHFFGEGMGFSFQRFNRFELDLDGAQRDRLGALNGGRIMPVDCWRRGEKLLPLAGDFGRIVALLGRTTDGATIVESLRRMGAARRGEEHADSVLLRHVQALEAMLHDGWVRASLEEGRPRVRLPRELDSLFRATAESDRALQEAKKVAGSP